MAITTPTLVADLPMTRSGPFSFNNDEGDADPAVELIAAPGAEKAIYLTSLTFSDRTVDCAVTIQDGDATVLFGPIQLQADGSGIITKDFKYPLKVTDNKSLNVFATNGVSFTVYGEYFIGQNL